jgi:uncharacterized membrane protein YhaH (DUF805 family)
MKKNEYFYIGLILAIIGFIILISLFFFGDWATHLIFDMPTIAIILLGLLFLIISVIKKK